MREATRSARPAIRASESLVAGLLRTAVAAPDRAALEVGERRFSYGELARRAGALARLFAERAPGRAPVAVFARRNEHAYSGILAALVAGRTYVPLNPKFPAARTRAMLRLSGATVLLADPETAGALSEVLDGFDGTLLVVLPEESDRVDASIGSGRHAWVSATGVPVLDATPEPPAVEPDDAAYLLFTSGTTGAPKGVPVSHRNVGAYVRYTADFFGIEAEDRFSQMFDLTFDLSVHDMFVCWERGACLVPVPDAAVMAPARFIRERELTVWFSVPSVARMMMRLRMLKPGSFPTLRLSLFCGEALPAAVAEQWQSAAPGSVLENLYGPTEATIAITRYRWDPATSSAECMNGIVPIGRVFPGHRTRLVAPDGAPGDVEEGELCVSGPQVTAGYLNDAERTREKFVALQGEQGTWYRTGDRVRRDAAGRLHYLGRIDDQVQVRGHRVELAEIDHVVSTALNGGTAVTIAWPVTDGSADGVVTFVAGEPERTEAELLAECSKRLPDYMVPRSIRFLDSLPLNANGKVDRRALGRYLEEGLLD